MSTERNKQVVTRFVEEVFNQKNLAALDEVVSSTFHSQEQDVEAAGVEVMREIIGAFWTAFPDGHLSIEHILAEGDKVMTWATFTGTHLGQLEAIPPTGKKVAVKDVDLWRLEDGKIVETWTHFDMPGLLQQIGVLTTAEGA